MADVADPLRECVHAHVNQNPYGIAEADSLLFLADETGRERERRMEGRRRETYRQTREEIHGG